MFKQRLFPLGMTKICQSVSKVDNNIIKSQDKMTKKVFLYSQGKSNHFVKVGVNVNLSKMLRGLKKG